MPEPSTSTVYDQELAIRIAGGNPTIATELLDLLIKDVAFQIEFMRRAHAEGNLEDLGKQAHKLNGSASYCGTPALKGAAETLEWVIAEAQDAQIEDAYARVMAEIERLLTYYEAHHRSNGGHATPARDVSARRHDI
jgi:two-component system sensor histidine kinase BarA